MPEYSVVKEQRKYFPLYFTSRKNRPVEHPKSTFWKNIFISAQNSVSIFVLYAYILSKHWWKSLSRLGGEERNPRRSRLSSPPTRLCILPTAVTHSRVAPPHHSRGGEQREKSPRERKNYLPLYYTPEKTDQWIPLKTRFQKIFLIMHKIKCQYLYNTSIILLASCKIPLSLHYIPRIIRPWKPCFSRKYIPPLYSRENGQWTPAKNDKTFCKIYKA